MVLKQVKWMIFYIIKDARKHKLRNSIAILSIALSVGLLVGMNVTVDTLSNSYVDIVIESSPDYDMEITSATEDILIENYQEFATNISNEIDLIDTFIPRYVIDASMVFTIYDFELTIPTTLVGINLTLENELGIGRLEPEISSLGINNCVLVGDFGRNIRENFNESGINHVNVTFVNPIAKILMKPSLNITTVVDDFQRLPNGFNIIVVDLAQFHLWFGDESSCTNIITKFNEPIYSSLDPEGSVKKARSIALDVQELIGLKYTISMPKAIAIKSADFSGIRLMLNFIAIILVIIATILIYSLNTISIEEKNREFAMLRTLGVPNSKLFLILIGYQLFSVFIGTVVGYFVGFLLTSLISNVLLSSIADKLTVTISMETFLFAAFIGGSAGLLSAINPSLSLLKRNIVNSLDIGKNAVQEYSIKRDRSVSKSMALLGFVLSLSGSLIFLIFPIIDILDDDILATTFYLCILFSFLLGMVLLALSLVSPLLEQLIGKILGKFKRSRKIGVLAITFLKRNRRRNSLTSTIFAISLAFILYLTMTSSIQTYQMTETLRHHYGADIVVQSTGLNGAYLNRSVEEFSKNIKDPVAGFNIVRNVSSVTTGNIISITGCIPTLGDLAFFESINPSNIYGIFDPSFPGALYKDPITSGENIWDKTMENQTIILSRSIARKLQLDIDDYIRLKLNSPITLTDLHYGKDLQLRIVGIVERVAGFTDIHSTSKLAYESGVFVGEDTWNTIVHDKLVNNSNQVFANQTIDRVFVKALSNDRLTTGAIQLSLFLEYGTAVFPIQIEMFVDFFKESQQESNELLASILALSLVIAFFAVFSSTQTGILEMRHEIGILSAVGLKTRSIIIVFIVESLILTITSTILGGLIGYSLAYLPFIQSAISTEFPIVILPLDPIIPAIYFTSVLLSIIGTLIPLRTMFRMRPAEILRQ